MNVFTKYSDRLLILLFTLIIFIPGMGMFIPKEINQFKLQFNREPYPFPPVTIKSLGRTDFKAIENWFVDQTLFMTSLSKICSNAMYKLGTSIKPGQAILGKDDWLFLGNDFSATIDQFTGKNSPTKEEIYLKLAVLNNMNKVAQQNNIPFLVVLAPDKHDIYPEYLPNNIQKGSTKSRLELLEEAMLDNGIDFIGLKQKEIEAKNTLGKQYGDIYLKGDSHWNYLGAYAAYQAISEYINNKGLKTNQVKINFLPQQTTYSDLSNFLQLTNIHSNNPLPDIKKLKLQMIGKDINGVVHPMGVFEGSPNILNAPYQGINKALKNKQTCLLIGDSFSEALSFYFHNDCHNTVRIHPENKAWNLTDLISQYKPDIIVYERVERDLLSPLFNFQITAPQVTLKSQEHPIQANGEINQFKITPDLITTEGWAYIADQDAGLNAVYIKLTSRKNSYLFSMNKILKQNMSLAFNHNGKHLNLAGFSGKILRKELPKGIYQASLVVLNKGIIGEKMFPKKYKLS